MSVGILLIATRKYFSFVPDLLLDIDRYFFPDQDDRQVYLFTDRPRPSMVGVRQFQIPSYGFPWATLYRFGIFSEFSDSLETDYLFYMDVDMRIVSTVADEILPDESGLVGVHHARCWSAAGTWESRPESTAYVLPENRHVYYAGGMFGGTRGHVLSMSRELHGCVQQDEKKDLIAVWHDESHMNRYFSDHPPKVLPPSYCFPPNPAPELSEYEGKIICLIKDQAVRS